MARPQDNPPPFFTTPYSPIIEEGADDFSGGGGCGCFRRFCLFGRDEGGSRSYLLQEHGGGDVHVHEHEEAWLLSQIKKLKQLSELVAGPKWKNFIRKIGRLCHHKMQAAPPYRYTPESYALNFAGDQDEEEDGTNLSHSFSVRFAPRVLNNDAAAL